MGSLGELIEFTRATVEGKQTPEAKVDRGGDDAVTAGHFSAPGDDSYPLASDVVFLSEDGGTGGVQIVGYQDAESAPVAGAGEKRIYARSGPGVVACEIWLQADGTVIAKNNLCSWKLDALGKVTVTTPLGTFGADTHQHNSPFGPTLPPIPGT